MRAPRPRSNLHPAVAVAANQTKVEYDRSKTVVDLLDESARQHGDRVAVLAVSGQSVTYAELRSESQRLAKRLDVFGVGRGSLVGVVGQRDISTVIVAHAILRAGATYVPLDAEWPEERINRSIEASGLNALLSTGPVAAPSGAEWEEVFPRRVDAVLPGVSIARFTRPDENRTKGRPQPEDIAYVITTSGSTGRPKPVAVRHNSVVNLIHWFNGKNGIGPEDVLAQVVPLNFDLAVYDLFGFLCSGGTLLVLNNEVVREPPIIASILSEYHVTLWNSAPATFAAVLTFMEFLENEAFISLRRVFLGGDWIPLSTHAKMSTHLKSATLVALGGATETCVWSNDFVVDRIMPDWKSVPYGYPMHNSRYYILRDDGSPADVDERGEIYISGDCVAAGYLNDPELTSARFTRDPWSDPPGDRMYRSGDMGKWTADGWIEFLGRVDHQVKIRGYRIELGEVESAANRCQLVQEAIASPFGAAHQPSLGMVLRTSGQLDLNGFRMELASMIPKYMIPSRVLVLESFPIGPTGKTDRQSIRSLLERSPIGRLDVR